MRSSPWVVATLLWGAACGGPVGAPDGGVTLEPCATTPAVTVGADQHFEVRPSGTLPGHVARPGDGGLRQVPGPPVVSFADFFTRPTPTQSWRAAPLNPIPLASTTDDLAALLDPARVGRFQDVYAFTLGDARATVEAYREATRFDPDRQLAVRVGVNGSDFLVRGLGPLTFQTAWTPGDQLIGGLNRFLFAEVTLVFSFDGDAACHLRNLTRIVKPPGPLTVADFFTTGSNAQLGELQRALAVARPHTTVLTLRSNGPAMRDVPHCELTSLESCLRLNETLQAVVDDWLQGCVAPTDSSLRGAPERCLVEGLLTFDPAP